MVEFPCQDEGPPMQKEAEASSYVLVWTVVSHYVTSRVTWNPSSLFVSSLLRKKGRISLEG